MELFEALKKATMDETEVQQSFKAAMDTSAVKAQTFNTELDKNTLQMKQSLAPALAAIAAEAIPLAKSFADLVTWIASKAYDNQTNAENAATHVTKNKDLAATPENLTQSRKDEAELRALVQKQGLDVSAPETDLMKNVVGFAGGFGQKVSDTKGAALLSPGFGLWAGIEGASEYTRLKGQNEATDEASYEKNVEALKNLHKTNEKMAATLEQIAKNTAAAGPPAAPPAVDSLKGTR